MFETSLNRSKTTKSNTNEIKTKENKHIPDKTLKFDVNITNFIDQAHFDNKILETKEKLYSLTSKEQKI